MNATPRADLVSILARLDQLEAEAETTAAAAGDVEVTPIADPLRETVVDFLAKVEEEIHD